MPQSLTVGIVPRERFAIAAQVIQRLYNTTRVDFHLIVVNPSMPDHYWRQVEAVIADKSDVEVINTRADILFNECKNLVARASQSDFTCIMDNHLMASDGCIDRLLATAVEFPADAVAPFTMEVTPTRHHEDQNLGFFDFLDLPQGTELRVRRLASPVALNRMMEPCLVDCSESHCMLFRTDVLKRLDLFDDIVTMHDFVDLGLALRDGHGTMVFEPRAKVTLMPPPPIHADELGPFLFTWDRDTAAKSSAHVASKWGIDVLPSGSAQWIEDRHHRMDRWTHLRFRLRDLATRRWKRAPNYAKRKLSELLELTQSAK